MYFSHHQGNYIRMAWAADLEGPWHLCQTGDALYVFYSPIGDSPESIQLSRIRLGNLSFDSWDPEYLPLEILSPVPGWEGGHITAAPSRGASAPEELNQSRDPYIFRDIDDSLYLFYAGKREDAIGVARISGIG
jgi:hypothetical protein